MTEQTPEQQRTRDLAQRIREDGVKPVPHDPASLADTVDTIQQTEAARGDRDQTALLPELQGSAAPADAGKRATPARTRYTLTDPDDLSFAQAMGIKAATGVDVFDPPDAPSRLAALVWYAGRRDGLTYADAMTYTMRDVDFPDVDVDPDAGNALDPATADERDPLNPTGGPATRSS